MSEPTVGAVVALVPEGSACAVRGTNTLAIALREQLTPAGADGPAEVVIDCTGDTESILASIEAAPDRATVIVTGHVDGLSIDLYPDVHRRGLTLLAV